MPINMPDSFSDIERLIRQREARRQQTIRRHQWQINNENWGPGTVTEAEVDQEPLDYFEGFHRAQMELMNAFYSFTDDTNSFRVKKENATTNEKLDIWIFETGKEKLITHMSKRELKEAIKQIKQGWSCYNQQNKVVTLKRVLEEKYGKKNG